MTYLGKVLITWSVACLLAVSAVHAGSIPVGEVDEQKIFYGASESFNKAGEVDYSSIVKSTPEYQEILDKKIEKGTAKYWILINNASEHAVRVISQVGEETEHDLIAAMGYLGDLETPIVAENLTDLVLEKLSNE